MRIPRGAWTLLKEVLRHLLRRPVVGIATHARTPDGRTVLIRRADTGQWVFPGGTLEWGETLRSCLERELREEAGVDLIEAGELIGALSDPGRDPRFHAVTLIVTSTVTEPRAPPDNPLEVLEVGLFTDDALPENLSHGMTDALRRSLAKERFWE